MGIHLVRNSEALATAEKLKDLSIGGLRITEAAFQSIRQIAGLERLDLGGGKFAGGGQRNPPDSRALGGAPGRPALA